MCMSRVNYSISAFIVISVLLLSVSCGKNDKQPPFVYEEQRIASIRNKLNGDNTAFTYDNEKRLSRIDFNSDGSSSVRFEYTLPTITVQYYTGAAPDITREKYTFTTLNGMVANYRVTRPDGTIYDTFFEYDNSNRIIEAGQRGISATGQLFMSMDCYISYNSQNNTQQVKIYGTWGFQETDSVTITRTFDPQNNYFIFHNIGFNYFGSFSIGIAYSIAGISDAILPFPFFTNRQEISDFPMTPAENAMVNTKTAGKSRNFSDPFNHSWVDISGEYQYPNSYYRYDDMGRLVEENNKYVFTWK